GTRRSEKPDLRHADPGCRQGEDRAVREALDGVGLCRHRQRPFLQGQHDDAAGRRQENGRGHRQGTVKTGPDNGQSHRIVTARSIFGPFSFARQACKSRRSTYVGLIDLLRTARPATPSGEQIPRLPTGSDASLYEGRRLLPKKEIQLWLSVL